MTINAVPGSARHAPRPHSAVAGGGTRQCARLAKICGADLADKPVVTRKAFRVVVDPVTVAIFGGGK